MMVKYAESMFALERFTAESIFYYWYEKGRAHTMKVTTTKVNYSGGKYYYDYDVYNVYLDIGNLPTSHIFTRELFHYVIETSHKYRRPRVNRQYYLLR